MGENSNIGWTHHTHNFWVGCSKVAPECANCYIGRTLARQGREPWGAIYKTKTWRNLYRWEEKARLEKLYYRVFTNSLADFFDAKADDLRQVAWGDIRNTPHMIYLILTKRPERIMRCLPGDWGDGYSNVWLGVSTGCRMTLNKMDSLRNIPCALRFVSMEPLLEDIAPYINLDGCGWGIAGGESGEGPEHLWDALADWKDELKHPRGRRTMKMEWAQNLWKRFSLAGLPFYFKQITAFRSGQGENALGRKVHEFPDAPGMWAEKRLAA